MPDLVHDVFADRWLNADLYRLWRAANDLYLRSIRGSIFYVAASIVFMLTIDTPQHLPLTAWLPALIYALLGWCRLANKVPTDGADASAYRRWRFRHWAAIDAGGLLWSGHIIKAGLMGQPYSITLVLALLCSIAYSTSICHSFAMDRRAAFLALSCQCLPGAVAFAFIFPGGLPIATGLLVHGFYAALMLDRSNKDYDAQIDTEHALILSRAETERLVAIDSLTGLANRRDYERRFEQAWHMAARQKSLLAMLVLDLDNFKKLNDSYGHAAGDACLRHFADILTHHFRRAGDLAARIGGEEFAVILPGTSASEAAQLGEEFRRSLAESRCVYQNQAIQVTASIGAGAADWDADHEPAATFARIDQACYQAKHLGRSRLVAV